MNTAGFGCQEAFMRTMAALSITLISLFLATGGALADEVRPVVTCHGSSG
jgi:hypothetical protein